MKKHTPGPWRIGDAGATVFGPPNGNPSPQTIAHMGKTDCKANAKLVAAAPDLLHACERALEILDAEPEACGIHKAHREIIQNAITKATE